MSNKPQTIDYLALVGLSLMWSSSFIFIKMAVDTVTPLTVAAGRMLLAAIVLYLVMKIRKVDLPTDRTSWTFFFLIGVVGNVVPFILISWAQVTVDSSVAAILIGAAPLISFVLGHFVTTDEKLNLDRTIGVIIGFVGIIVLIGPEAIMKLGNNAISQLAIVAGAGCYVSASFIARKMPDMDPFARAAGVLIMASVIGVPISLVFDQPWDLVPSLLSVGAIFVLGIFPTALATVLLFFVISRVGATFVALNNYLNPVLGVVWGYLFFSEVPSVQIYTGLGLILGGMILTQLRISNYLLGSAKS